MTCQLITTEQLQVSCELGVFKAFSSGEEDISVRSVGGGVAYKVFQCHLSGLRIPVMQKGQKLPKRITMKSWTLDDNLLLAVEHP